MWLALRENITPSAARAWYTHIRAERLKKYLRMFTGNVSENAIIIGEDLRLEHFLRIQTTLTKLIKKHIENDIHDSNEFIDTIHRC